MKKPLHRKLSVLQEVEMLRNNGLPSNKIVQVWNFPRHKKIKVIFATLLINEVTYNPDIQ